MADEQTYQTGNQTIQLEVQPWDSEILQRSCARIIKISGDDSLPDFGLMPEELERRGLDYVTVRWPQDDRKRIEGLVSAGFEVVDGIVALKRELENLEPTHFPQVRLATAQDAREVAELAGRTFRFSRFHNDPAIYREQADKVHYEWAWNSCLGKAADAVLLWVEGGRIAGFSTVALKGDTATIVLVAVADEYSGHGIAGKLTLKCCEWMKSRGVRYARVQTQSHNVAAQTVYKRSGFATENLFTTLRWAKGRVPFNLGRLATESFLQLEVEFFQELDLLAREVGANIDDVWKAVAADARIGAGTYNPLNDPAEDEHLEGTKQLLRVARGKGFDFKLLQTAAARVDVMELLRSTLTAVARWRPVVRKNSELDQ